MSWTVIAEKIRNLYTTPEGRCKICGEKIVTLEDRKGYQILKKIYRHFMEKHREELEEIKRILQ